MAKTNAPFGLRPINRVGQGYNTAGFSTYEVQNGYATPIYHHDPVIYNPFMGEVEAFTSTTNVPLGIFLGCKYIDPVTKQPVRSNFLPAGVSSAVGQIEVYVADDPNQTFLMQLDTTSNRQDVGRVYNFLGTTHGNGSNVTGQSAVQLDRTPRTANQGTVRIMSLWDEPGNEWAVTGTCVVCKWHRHFWSITSVDLSASTTTT